VDHLAVQDAVRRGMLSTAQAIQFLNKKTAIHHLRFSGAALIV
jgi:hypothetical protein